MTIITGPQVVRKDPKFFAGADLSTLQEIPSKSFIQENIYDAASLTIDIPNNTTGTYTATATEDFVATAVQLTLGSDDPVGLGHIKTFTAKIGAVQIGQWSIARDTTEFTVVNASLQLPNFKVRAGDRFSVVVNGTIVGDIGYAYFTLIGYRFV